MPVAALLSGGNADKPESSFVVRATERRHITWPKEGLSWELLSVPGQRECTALLGRIPPHFRDTAFSNPRHYQGMIWSHVLAGQVTVQIGDVEFVAKPGDSYTGAYEHFYWVHNETDEVAIVLAVLVPGVL